MSDKYLAMHSVECVVSNINTLTKGGLLKEALEWCLYFASWFSERDMEATAAGLLDYAQKIERAL